MRKKSLALLVVLTILATLFVGVMPASASCTYTMSNTTTVKVPAGTGTAAGQGYAGLGTITIDFPSVITVGATSFVLLSLPSSPTGIEWTDATVFVPTDAGGTSNAIDPVQGAGHSVITVTKTDARTLTIDLSAAAIIHAGNPGRIIIGSDGAIGVHNFSAAALTGGPKVYIPAGISGPLNVTAAARSSSIFTSGTITIANVGTGTVKLAVESVKSIGSSGGNIGVIDLTEGLAGALVSGTALKLQLPPGFTWANTPTITTTYWGDVNVLAALNNPAKYSISDDGGRTLKLTFAPGDVSTDVGANVTLQGTIMVDESIAKTGDVHATVGGDSTTNITDLVVATYGDMTVNTTAMTRESLIAGISGQKIGEIKIAESLAKTFDSLRSMTVTLPSGAKWEQAPSTDGDITQNNTGMGNPSWTVVGTDGRILKMLFPANAVNGESDPSTFAFKNWQVILAPDFPAGDFKVTLAGTFGATGDLVLGTVSPAVTATASAAPEVRIGLYDQAAGDVTIVEGKAGAIVSTPSTTSTTTVSGYYVSTMQNGNTPYIVLKAPSGVTFTTIPTVAVTDGDLQIDAAGVKTENDDNQVAIPIKGVSTQASTIKVTGIKLTIDRTAPEGNLKFKVGGNAINDSLTAIGNVGVTSIFAGADSVVTVVAAKVITPAPGEQKATASFTIGSTKYKVNGVEKDMDVAPYINDGRTFMPLRYVGMAMGINEQNIIWDDAAKTVTLMKGDKVVQVKIGSTTMLVNGIAITMDVAPEIKDGRTMLPLRWQAQAFGATNNWDAATNTATVS